MGLLIALIGLLILLFTSWDAIGIIFIVVGLVLFVALERPYGWRRAP